MSTSPPFACDLCHDEYWIRTRAGWRRCDCFSDLLSEAYIKPMIRQGEVRLPDEARAHEAWPLKDKVVTGADYTAFRRQVWRSLLFYAEHRPVKLTYDYFEANRLCEIYFKREDAADDGYRSIRDLRKLDLLVLVVGVADLPNQYLSSLVHSVRRLREMHGRPTWIFTTTAGLLKAPAPGGAEVRTSAPMAQPSGVEPSEKPLSKTVQARQASMRRKGER